MLTSFCLSLAETLAPQVPFRLVPTPPLHSLPGSEHLWESHVIRMTRPGCSLTDLGMGLCDWLLPQELSAVSEEVETRAILTSL